jgi:uncharacterized protein
MSAAQPKASEPSMEEILASIRKIISDEPMKADTSPPPVSAPAAVAPAPPPAAQPDDDDEVMDLKPKAKTQEPHFIADDPVGNDVSFSEDAPAMPKSQDDIDALMAKEFSPPAPVTVPPMPLILPPRVEAPVAPAPAEHRLISDDTNRAASLAFSSLASTILSRDARTLEDLMQEMMRPMIKSWLDDNLPTVVERLVKAEIERVARGGR